ncbi:MAG: pantoate--beta-alanine ligase [Acidobacteria bacterium]|nr:pantoate--beta-alanine ligase [Acidobacteriota bacterium]
MEIINRATRMVSVARDLRADGKIIGLVPTMGALHEGHLALMSQAREMCDTVIASVFVNPTQFAAHEDLAHYPRDLARDAELAFTRNVDYIFAPTPDDVYPNGYKTYINVETISERLEGAARPGHFRGVATVVNKLFNIVHPHFAFFGRKDAQQVILIKRMVKDLVMDVEIVVGPTVREEDGLALSSRNVYLSTDERKAATVLRRALEKCRSLYHGGERDSGRLLNAMRAIIEAEPLARLDYLAITDTTNLEAVTTVPYVSPTLVSMAVFFGKTRLIDNIVLNGEI